LEKQETIGSSSWLTPMGILPMHQRPEEQFEEGFYPIIFHGNSSLGPKNNWLKFPLADIFHGSIFDDALGVDS
jgi:hypothetical protein